jgi:hypothetical protein
VEAEGNALLASVENMQYAVSVDVLHTVSQSEKRVPFCDPYISTKVELLSCQLKFVKKGCLFLYYYQKLEMHL